MPQVTLTPEEYLSKILLLDTEIADAIIVHYTYEEINRLARHDASVLEAINKNVLFWKTQLHSLQTTLFMTLSRIFDTDYKATTIHSLLNATLANLHIVSHQALYDRKVKNGLVSPLLGDYMAKVWIPTVPADLRHLKTVLKPFANRFEAVYKPIRNSIFAHRLMSNSDADAMLFADASRDEVSHILDFLHDLIDAIYSLYLNGRRPEIETRSYTEHNQRIRDSVGLALKRI